MSNVDLLKTFRRIYGHVRRSNLRSMQQLFDELDKCVKLPLPPSTPPLLPTASLLAAY